MLELKRDLSFDPTTSSHRLTSHPNEAATDAKRVLLALTGRHRDRRLQRDSDREGRCLADIDRLVDRGQDNHCADFIESIRTVLRTLFWR